MVFLSKDYNLDSYIFGCPILNNEARRKLEHMGLEVLKQCECEKKEECSPNSEIGRISKYSAKREILFRFLFGSFVLISIRICFNFYPPLPLRGGE